jgi:hypothetical protein
VVPGPGRRIAQLSAICSAASVSSCGVESLIAQPTNLRLYRSRISAFVPYVSKRVPVGRPTDRSLAPAAARLDESGNIACSRADRVGFRRVHMGCHVQRYCADHVF